jgi:transposase
MATTPAELPDTIEELRALVLLQQEKQTHHEVELSERNEEISQLREYIRLLKSQRFGASSERSPSSQLGLFNEAESIVDEDEGLEGREAPTIEVPAHTRRKRGGRKALPAFLPREEIVHDLSEEEKVCGNDAEHKLARIGEDRLEQLVFIPASAKVLVHIRPKYACSSCKDAVKAAPPPPSPIPKSFATPSLLAQIVTSKYVDALPLHRQAKIFQRMGVDLCRATMAAWVIKMGELVTPLLAIILAEIRKGN